MSHRLDIESLQLHVHNREVLGDPLKLNTNIVLLNTLHDEVVVLVLFGLIFEFVSVVLTLLDVLKETLLLCNMSTDLILYFQMTLGFLQGFQAAVYLYFNINHIFKLEHMLECFVTLLDGVDALVELGYLGLLGQASRCSTHEGVAGFN